MKLQLAVPVVFFAFATILQFQENYAHVITPSSPTSNIPTLNSTIVHQATCDRNDFACWCIKAVQYTNDVRRQRGARTLLKVGPESQLANANNYAHTLAQMQRLEHQDFSTANREIGCGRALGGENVAMNSDNGDIARSCVDQWVGSSGHLENIMQDWFLEVVVGFAYDGSGGVYCVQTFSVTDDGNGSANERGCEPVGVSSRSGGMSDPAPEPEPESESGSMEEGEEEPETESMEEEELEPEDEREPMEAPREVEDRFSPSSPSRSSERRTSRVGSLACRCVRRGRRCSQRLAEHTGNVCSGGARRREQTRECQYTCCEYCRSNSSARDCQNNAIRRMC